MTGSDAKRIREGYDEIADKIRMPEKFYRACIEVIGDLDPKEENVLDLGCGNGFLLKNIGERWRGVRLCGLEHSMELCRRATVRLDSKSIAQGDALALPIKDASVSLVTATEMLEHVEEPLVVLKEAFRVLTSGGRLLISVPNREWYGYERYLTRRSAFQPVDDRWFSPVEIKSMIEEAGFTVAKVRGQENLYFGGGPGRGLEKIGLSLFPKLQERMKRLIVLAGKPG
jgi:ubiquinone/menaquinone biosynthesis C-methylase UbiE